MKSRQVVFAAEASSDLEKIHIWLSETASDQVADRYLDRIFEHCRKFDIASERGTQRNDLLPGLRVTGFEKRVVIAFVVEDAQVIILRFFYGGQDWEQAFET